MASGLYNKARQRFLEGGIDWVNGNIDVLLVQSTYAFDATDQVLTDIAGEVSATDYARKDLTGRTLAGTTTTEAKAANPTWAGLGGATNQTIGGAIVFLNTGADASSVPICFIDTVDQATQNTDVTVSFAGGIVFTWANA